MTTPFGPLPGMPGGPPWGSIEAVNALTWHQQQQMAAAHAAHEMAVAAHHQANAVRVREAELTSWILLLFR